MTVWATHLRIVTGAALLSVFVLSEAPVSAAPSWLTHATVPLLRKPIPELAGSPNASDPVKPTVDQLRARAVAAEKAGDWEGAFTALCELHATDRASPDTRERLNAALRRVQQIHRHREPAFRQFVAGLPLPDAVALFAETAAKVPAMFADPAKATPQHLWANGVEELHRALALPGFRQAFLGNPPMSQVDAFRSSLRTYWGKRPISDSRAARDTLKQLVASAQDAFPVRVPSALAVEVICGACTGLDEYTVFLTPSQATETPEPVADLSIYGLYIEFPDSGPVIAGVAPGSWAAFTTARKGQRITRVNGRVIDTAGPVGLADALRVPVNGTHEIELLVPGGEPWRATLRLPLSVPTVYGDRIIDSKEGGVGYVRIREFQASTPRELTEAITSLKARGMRVMLLDLRGNHGGSFLAGVEVARRLLPGGMIVTTQGQLGQVAGQVYSSDAGMAALDLPLVVLIDAETASAAEVVAAAVRDNDRGLLVGMPTFGKGTIQYPLRLNAADEVEGMTPPRSRSGTVRVTIARLIAPRGASINGVGITPHVIDPDPTRQIEIAILRGQELLQPGAPRSPMPIPPDQ